MTIRFIPVLFIIILSFFYLLFSILYYHPAGELLVMTFRQFGIILYLILSYLLFNLLVKDETAIKKIVDLLKHISVASVWLQVIYIAFGYLFIRNFALFAEGQYNYFSPLIILGIITYAAWVLAYEQNVFSKFSKYFFCIALSTTLGHSSAFLAVFCILLIYLFVRIKPLQRLVAVGLMVTALVILLALPQFRDANASWRILYWGHVLQQSIQAKFAILGSGFGQPYMTYNFAVHINETIGSSIMVDEFYPMARYLSPPHNSWLSFVFHIGLLPSLLFLLPLKKIFLYAFVSPLSADREKNFLLFALVGCIMWVSFNVILELPHSATYFWLIYFTASYAFQTKKTGSRNV